MKKVKAIPVPPPPGYLEEWREVKTTCLVTGATDGIGKALAIRLADAGQTLAVVGRSQDKIQAVLKDIREAGPNRQHRGFVADLSLMSEVSRLAQEVQHHLPDLNRIVLCAAELPGFHGLTSEGVEAGFAVNYLSRFHLLNALTPLLKQQPAARIVTFVKTATRFQQPDITRLNDPTCPLNNWDRRLAQMNCNLLHVLERAEQLKDTGICINAFGPGLVLTRHVKRYSFSRRFWLNLKGALIGKSPPYAALPAMHMLLSPGFETKTGGFYEAGTRVLADERFLNTQMRSQLWEETIRLLQLAQTSKGSL